VPLRVGRAENGVPGDLDGIGPEYRLKFRHNTAGRCVLSDGAEVVEYSITFRSIRAMITPHQRFQVTEDIMTDPSARVAPTGDAPVASRRNIVAAAVTGRNRLLRRTCSAAVAVAARQVRQASRMAQATAPLGTRRRGDGAGPRAAVVVPDALGLRQFARRLRGR
jgi:hypothetical protein